MNGFNSIYVEYYWKDSLGSCTFNDKTSHLKPAFTKLPLKNDSNSIYAEYHQKMFLGLNKFNDKTLQLKPGFTTLPLRNKRLLLWASLSFALH